MCDQKEALGERYRVAADEFCSAVNELQENIGTSKKEAYKKLYGATRSARIGMEQARLDLEKHVSEHGC